MTLDLSDSMRLQMRFITLAAAGIGGATSWLALLVASGFNPFVVGAGLIVALSLNSKKL